MTKNSKIAKIAVSTSLHRSDLHSQHRKIVCHCFNLFTAPKINAENIQASPDSRLSRELRARSTRLADERYNSNIISVVDDEIDLLVYSHLLEVLQERYLYRKKKYRKSDKATTVFTDDLEESQPSDYDSDNSKIVWLSEENFLHKYRMSRESFKVVANLIRDHPNFEAKRGRKQRPVEHQLMVFLDLSVLNEVEHPILASVKHFVLDGAHHQNTVAEWLKRSLRSRTDLLHGPTQGRGSKLLVAF